MLVTQNVPLHPAFSLHVLHFSYDPNDWLVKTPHYWLPANNYSHYSPNRHSGPAINEGCSQPWSGHDGGIRTAVRDGGVMEREEDVWACCQQAWDVDDKWPALVFHQADVSVNHRASDWMMQIKKRVPGLKAPFTDSKRIQVQYCWSFHSLWMG